MLDLDPPNREGEGRGVRIRRIRLHGVLIGQVLDSQGCHFRSATAAGGKSGQKQRAIAQVDQAFTGTGPQQLGQDIAGHRLFALSLPRTRAGTNGETQGRFERRAVE
ncbi:hypothetical protein FQZ97_1252050 [compost metagenome]